MRQKIVDEATPLLLALTQYGALADEEIEALRNLTSSTRRLPPGIDLLEQGERGKSSYLILDGWTYSYKDLEDGRRQIVSFQIPGDFLGLRSILLRTADYSSATLTDCRVALVPSAEWERLVADHPRLCAAVLWLMAREGAMLVEHMINLGRRSADQRTAHLLCECGYRLRVHGAIDGNAFVCPISQSIMADALGLSVVHLNRTLRRLREQGMVKVLKGKLHVLDLEKLEELAEFDNGYLD